MPELPCYMLPCDSLSKNSSTRLGILNSDTEGKLSKWSCAAKFLLTVCSRLWMRLLKLKSQIGRRDRSCMGRV